MACETIQNKTWTKKISHIWAYKIAAPERPTITCVSRRLLKTKKYGIYYILLKRLYIYSFFVILLLTDVELHPPWEKKLFVLAQSFFFGRGVLWKLPCILFFYLLSLEIIAYKVCFGTKRIRFSRTQRFQGLAARMICFAPLAPAGALKVCQKTGVDRGVVRG